MPNRVKESRLASKVVSSSIIPSPFDLFSAGSTYSGCLISVPASMLFGAVCVSMSSRRLSNLVTSVETPKVHVQYSTTMLPRFSGWFLFMVPSNIAFYARFPQT